MKKTLLLTVFVIASSSFAMENDTLILEQMDSGVGEAQPRQEGANDFKNKIWGFVDKIQGLLPSAKAEPTKAFSEGIVEKQIDNESVKVTWLTKKNASTFGIGAVALITIGYITYVFYKNGTIKKAADAMKKHPYGITGSVTGTIALISGFFAYKYYYAKPVGA